MGVSSNPNEINNAQNSSIVGKLVKPKRDKSLSSSGGKLEAVNKKKEKKPKETQEISETTTKKSKAMKLMGLTEADMSKAEEEAAQALLIEQSSKKTIFRNKFREILKRQPTTISKKRSELNSQIPKIIINLINEQPIFCKINENEKIKLFGKIEEENKLSFPIDNFIRHTNNNTEIINKDNNHANNNQNHHLQPFTNNSNSNLKLNESSVVNDDKTISTTVGFGLLHIEYDRFWQKTKFNGECYFSGILFHNHSKEIQKYVQYLSTHLPSQIKVSHSLSFIQQLTKTSNFNALEELQLLDVFSGNKTCQISCGASNYGFTSNLGEFHISSSLNQENCCLGNFQSFKNWNGGVTGQKILGRRISSIHCGPYHYGVITDTNEIILWGNNLLFDLNHSYDNIIQDLSKIDLIISGQQGNNQNYINSPNIINSIPGKPLFIRCGLSFTIIVTSEGVFSFGYDHFGQLGRISSSHSNENFIPHPVPGIIDRFGVNCVICEISCGSNHTISCTEDGLVFTWGSNHYGQLGHSPRLLFISQATLLPEISSVISVACGNTHSVFLDKNGKVYTSGSNFFGELGVENFFLSLNYVPIHQSCIQNDNGNEFLNPSIVKICASSYSTMAMNNIGYVYKWGFLRSINMTQHQYTPRLVTSIIEKQKFIVDISSGISHDILLSDLIMSELLPILSECCFYKNYFTCNPLFKRILTLPHIGKSFEFLQKRVLYESYSKQHQNQQQTQTQQQTQIPFVIPLKSYFKIIDCSEKRKSAFFIITLFNPNDFSIRVSFSFTDIKNGKNQNIILEPDEIKISKRSKLNIKVLVLYSQILTNKTYGMIHFTSEKDFSSFGGNIINTGRSSLTSSTNGSPTSTQSSTSSLQSNPSSQNTNNLSQSQSNINTSSSNLKAHCFILYSLNPKKISTQLLQNNDHLHDHQAPGFQSLQLVKTLGTYIPNVLLQYIIKHPNPPKKPHIQEFPAAILFLDISGFTSLNERLAQLGPAGPELVSKHINSYFASLIKAVSEHGGDVLKFAGDALICMWSGCKNDFKLTNHQDIHDMDDLTWLTMRAIQCGFDIQTRLDKYDSNEGFSLTLHIGVGSGELLSLFVGSKDSWEFLVSGEPLAQLRTAVDNSKTGEVVISKESYSLVSKYCIGEARDDDFYIREIIHSVPKQTKNKIIKGWPRADTEACLRCFIPMAVQVHLDSQHLQGGWGNELRCATILFVKLNSNIPNDCKEIYLSSINSILCIMQESIFKYEGMVRQFLADDKGTVLIAAFGLPPFCHMDDPLRGINCALEISKNLLKFNMDCSIGVTTGQVFCGSVGCPVRQEYAMVGDVVNLSARLMVHSYKENLKILCDKPTYDSCNDNISFKILDPIMVKGKKDPISIYLPLTKEIKKQRYHKDIKQFFLINLKGRKLLMNELNNSSSSSSYKIIGRKKEKQIIKDSISKLHDSTIREKRKIFFYGTIGIGKSLLCNYIMQLCKQNHIFLCHTEGDHFQKVTPLYPFRSILFDLFGFTNVFSPDNDDDDQSYDHSQFSNNNNSLFSDKLDELYLFLILLLPKSYHSSIPLLLDLFFIHENKLQEISSFYKENSFTKSLTKEERIENLSFLIKQILYEFSLQKRKNQEDQTDKMDKNSEFVMILEDIHYFDDYSISLLFSIVKDISSILVFMTSRHLHCCENLINNLPCILKYELPHLSEHDISKIILNIFGINELPSSISILLRTTYGNPLIACEIAFELLDSGIVTIDKNGVCNINGNLNDINLPSIDAIIKAKLDRLTSTQQMVLKVGLYHLNIKKNLFLFVFYSFFFVYF